MATNRRATDGIEVVPLGTLGAGSLEWVLAEQRREWRERLDWDLGEVSRLIASAVAERALRGSAVLVGGEPAGYAFYAVESGRCLVGDIADVATALAAAEGDRFR